MRRCASCGVEGVKALYCRACGEFSQHTRQFMDNVRKRRHREGRRHPPADKVPLSELIRNGDEAAVKVRLDKFSEDIAEEILDRWGVA